jgi:archaellum component FlaC
MPKVTLKLILSEIQKTNDRLDRIENKNDDRFELVKQEFQIVHSELNQRFEIVDERFDEVNRRFEIVDERFDGIDRRFNEVDTRFHKVDMRFDKVDSSIELLAIQTLSQINQSKSLDARIMKLEASSA